MASISALSKAPPQIVDSVSSWEQAKCIFHEKLKEEEGGDLTKVQEFLHDSTTIKQAVESCVSAGKKADGEYSEGYVMIAGRQLFLRKRLARILKKVQMFVQFGDIAIQHNPETTSLVWAAFRMMLQVAINDIETCELLTDACEEIAGTLFVCEVYERRHRAVATAGNSDNEVAQKVVDQIPPLYAIILELSYDAKKFLSKNKIARFLRSGTGLKFRGLIDSIRKRVQQIHTSAGVAFQEEALASLAGLHKEFNEQFEDMRQFLQEYVFSITEDTNRNVQEINSNLKKKLKVDEQKRLEMEYEKNVKWLEPLEHLEDPGSEYRLNLDRRQPNTCTWIFNHTEYKTWYGFDSSKILWVSGNAGFGKSVLVSSIIENLRGEDDSRIVLFFFCKIGDDSTQRAGSVLRNLIFQLYEKTRDLPELYTRCTKVITKAQSSKKTKRGEMVEYAKSVKSLKQILEEIVEIFGKQVFVVIDALDECKDRKPEALLAALRGLIEAEDIKVKIILASRPEIDIEETLQGVSRVEVNQDSNSVDIKAYLVKELKKLPSLKPKDRKIACKAIIERSDGMFRYANMQIDRLRQPWRPPLKNHLDALPVGLEASYRQIFEQIKPELQELLMVALRWTILADGDIPALLVAEDYRRVFELVEAGDEVEDDKDDGDDEDEDFGDDEGGGNGEADHTKDKTEDHDEMLENTIIQIKEAGSVFLESGGNETTMSLRHASVKDFMLNEGERTYSRTDSQHIPCQLCQRCNASISQTSALTITPKLGHLSLVLSIFNHLNSTAFIERYLPVLDEATKDELSKITESTNITENSNPENPEKQVESVQEGNEVDTGGPGNLEDKEIESTNHDDEADHPDGTTTDEILRDLIQKDEIVETLENKGDCAPSIEDPSISIEPTTNNENSVEEDLVQPVTEEVEVAQLNDTDPENQPEDDEKNEGAPSEADSDYGAQDEHEVTDANVSETKLRYEFTHWIYHLREAEQLWASEERETSADWARLWGLVDKFLLESSASFIRWQYAVWASSYPYLFDTSSLGKPIHVAASYGLTALVERLLDRGADVNSVNPDGVTALYLAADTQEPSTVELLLKRGASVHMRSWDQTTPLCRVAAKLNGNAKIAKLLLDGGSEPGASDLTGVTPIHSACLNGNIEVFRLLVASGADVKVKDNSGESPLHFGLKRADPPLDLIEELIRLGADVNEQDNNSQAPLYVVSRASGSTAIINLLLSSGADINDDDVFGYTALHSAAVSGSLGVVTLLVEKGADLSLRDKKGNSALAWAAQYGNVDVVKYLIQRLAAQGNESYITAVDIRGRTALHRAAAKGHVDVVEMLLTAENTDSTLPARESIPRATPLHAAAYQGHEMVVKILLKNGGDVKAQNRLGETPIDLALKGWSRGVERREGPINCLICMAKSAPETILGSRGLLHIAARKGSDSIVRQLLELGVDPNEIDEHGWTSALVALQYDRPTIVDILKSHGQNPDFPHAEENGPLIGNPPTVWADYALSTIGISEDGMELHYTGTDWYYSIGLARGNHPMPFGKYVFYYEIAISENGIASEDFSICHITSPCVVTLGIGDDGAPLDGRFPGWDTGSYGYHGDDGKKFAVGAGTDYGETFGPGDTVGCGMDFRDNTVFFTKNGISQGIAFHVGRSVWYPVVGIRHNMLVRVNFGQDKTKPFLYTLADSDPVDSELGNQTSQT